MSPFFICKIRLLTGRNAVVNSSFFQCEISTLLVSRCFSTSTEGSSGAKQDGRQSFTLSYLKNSCGLTPQAALTVSKSIRFETLEKPDSVLTFLRNHGFTDKHIPSLIRGHPNLLLANPEKTLLPKIQFFHSKGCSTPDIVKIFHLSPAIFSRSVPNHLTRCYDFIKGIVKSDEKVVRALKRSSRLFNHIFTKSFASNIEVLRELGMPDSFLSVILTCYSSTLLQGHAKFKEKVEQLIEMGFDPKKWGFIHALQVLSSMTQATLEHKMKIYKKWGWSEEDVRLAFRKHPICLSLSEKKIIGGMDFLVMKMGWPPAAIARVPIVLDLNLEKRIIPRCSVTKVLQMKGLTNRNFFSSTIFLLSDKEFLDKFVVKYKEHAPQLLAVYQGRGSLRLMCFDPNRLPHSQTR